MSAKCVKSYYNALVLLSFCYFEVKVYYLFIFSFLVLLFVLIDYVSNTIYSDIQKFQEGSTM